MLGLPLVMMQPSLCLLLLPIDLPLFLCLVLHHLLQFFLRLFLSTSAPTVDALLQQKLRQFVMELLMLPHLPLLVSSAAAAH